MPQLVTHSFEPVYDKHSRVLVLGTMPSPASRKNGFYYSHPRNRFWPVMAVLFECAVPTTAEEKRALCLEKGVALWDVLKSCSIEGASDASIRRPEPNDIPVLLAQTNIRAVFTTGGAASKLYERYFGSLETAHIALPSTSPANARMSLDALVEAYRPLLKMLAD